MRPGAHSAGRKRSTGDPPPVFAGVGRETHALRCPRSSGQQIEVLGQRCRLFDGDGGAAAALAAGEHLLPCFGDDATTVDRFDARLLLAAAPTAVGGGRSHGATPEATPAGQEAELDAERYRDLQPAGEAADSNDDAEHDRGEMRYLPSRHVACGAVKLSREAAAAADNTS